MTIHHLNQPGKFGNNFFLNTFSKKVLKEEYYSVLNLHHSFKLMDYYQILVDPDNWELQTCMGYQNLLTQLTWNILIVNHPYFLTLTRTITHWKQRSWLEFFEFLYSHRTNSSTSTLQYRYLEYITKHFLVWKQQNRVDRIKVQDSKQIIHSYIFPIGSNPEAIQRLSLKYFVNFRFIPKLFSKVWE